MKKRQFEKGNVRYKHYHLNKNSLCLCNYSVSLLLKRKHKPFHFLMAHLGDIIFVNIDSMLSVQCLVKTLYMHNKLREKIMQGVYEYLSHLVQCRIFTHILMNLPDPNSIPQAAQSNLSLLSSTQCHQNQWCSSK